MRKIRRLLARVVLVVATSVPVAALAYTARLATGAGLSPWGAGPDLSFNQFIGPQWQGGVGPVNLSLKACADIPVLGETCVGYGADGQASSRGRLGFDFGLNASGGSVGVYLPMEVNLNVGDGMRGVIPGVIEFPTGGFSMTKGGHDYLNGSGQVTNAGGPIVRSSAPTFDAHLDAVMEIAFSAGGHICYVGCLGGSVSEQFSNTVSLFDVGPKPGGGYEASILGQSLLSLPYSVAIPPGSNVAALSLNVPNVNTDSNFSGGYDPATDTVRSAADDAIFRLTLDLTALVGKLFPFLEPFVGSHSLGPVGSYDLLSASIGMVLRYVDEFVARINDVVVGFLFSDPVSVSRNGPPTLGALLNDGESLSVYSPQGDYADFESVGVLPIFFVQPAVHHSPSLVPAVEGELKVLQFEVAGEKLGPVANPKFSVDLGEFDLPEFDILGDYIPIVGQPFSIRPGRPPIASGIADPCAFILCINNDFRIEFDECGDDDPADCNSDVRPNRIWRVDASCPLSTPIYQCPGAFLLEGMTSPSGRPVDPTGSPVFTNLSSLVIPPGLQGPLLGDQYARDWLGANEFTGVAPDFAAFPPYKFPFDIAASVPEPGTLVLLALGLAGLAAIRRRMQ